MAPLLKLSLQKFFLLKKSLQHTLVFLMAGIVLLSTTGVSVHKMYCYCKGQMVASVFCPDDPCEDAPYLSEKAGCCKDKPCSPASGPGHKGCSDCRSEFVKLDVQYVLFSCDFQLTAPAAFLGNSALAVEILPQAFQPKVSWLDDLPPPAGKELLPWLQSFLC